MTRLEDRKTRLSFETAAAIRYRGRMRPIIVEIAVLQEKENGEVLNDPFSATVRLSGTRIRYPFSWHGVFNLAAKNYADQKAFEKRQARAERRKAKP